MFIIFKTFQKLCLELIWEKFDTSYAYEENYILIAQTSLLMNINNSVL